MPKHFPGYGNIIIDPHKNKAFLYENDAEFEKSVSVFKEVISKINPEMIMTAHIVIPSVDSSPATLSSKIITDLLRKKLNYNGVVVTDDLEMASVMQNRNIGIVAVEALVAGNDMLIATSNPKNIEIIVNAVKDALADKIISETMLKEKISRVMSLKLKFFQYKN